MTVEAPSPSEPDTTETSTEELTTGDQPIQKKKARPWITAIACTLCVVVFGSILTQPESEQWLSLVNFGILSTSVFWDNAVWVPITSVFVHLELWHFVFNLYWLWVLGSRMERAIGSLPFLGFFLAAAWVSSMLQLYESAGTGIGASGVIYAFFGFMWPTLNRYPEFREVLTRKIIQLFVVWMIGCVVVTHLGIFNIGNAAHISGFLFGGAVAGTYVLEGKERLMRTGIAVLVILSIIPLVTFTFNTSALKDEAYEAHVLEKYELAITYYSRIIQREPDNAWAYLNRGYAHYSLGHSEEAESDAEMAHELDPDIDLEE